MLTIDGLITGIDTESIVNGLLEIQQTQIDRLNVRRQDAIAQRSAYDSLEAQLLALQSTSTRLGQGERQLFQARTVEVNDETSLSATATSNSAIGSYQLTINSLARAHQVVSNGFEDTDSAITEGTLSLRVGSGTESTITIDSSNNTLQGLVDAINLSNSEVDASIIHSDSRGTTPYRIFLSAKETGAANTIQITNNLGASSGSATAPTFDFDNPVQAATDAEVQLGEGPGALTIHQSTNRLTNMIQGVTIDLLRADETKPIEVRVARNTEPAYEAITEFVDAFNGLMDSTDSLVRYNAETDEAGLLNGDRTAISIQNEIRTLILDVVPNVGSHANRLSALGISVTDNGRLSVNSGRLQSVLAGEDAEFTDRDLIRLFTLTGNSTHPNVSFLLGSSRTQPSDSPYEVDITQAAERAIITGDASLAASTTINSGNNTLQIKVDGATADVTLQSGDYTAAELAELLERTINQHSELSGRQVSVSLDSSGQLRIQSDSFGSISEIAILDGTALSELGLTQNPSDTGVDVAGNFLVNGQVESATGRGRLLTGNADNENTGDLQLRVTLTPSQVSAGADAEVTVTKGIASRLGDLISRLTRNEFGQLYTARELYDRRILTIEETIERQQAIFDEQQEDLIAQFVTLESSISELQNTSSFLASQLASVSQLSFS
ncbi:Flagellar hook-associated protein 2 [Thalassoglobus neptunius]|uniref:Flagellar hook-associated protein 2 n=1 Tax=Thalassoglobus neptunius TaxID=1938619 RepID=A0A5C5VPH6_9PLAN|nr:flagellar filament capping protein FliD [Thalassoglobus neptunius]TWT39835.1 Flagellar hook-associated protein 2 [Thalassoglobus neptunius]